MNDETLVSQYLLPLFQFDSVWSVVTRFIFWIVIVLTIIASVDIASKYNIAKNVRANLGLILFVMMLAMAILIFIISQTSPDQFPHINKLLQGFSSPTNTPAPSPI